MARFPDSPRPLSPYNFRSNRPFIAGGPAWAPESRSLTRFGLAEADLDYKGKSWADMQTVYSFFESVGGPGGRFTFVDFNGIGPIGGADPGVPWTGLYVAVGDGAAATWDAPTFATQASPAPVVYENSVAKTTAIWTSGSTTPAAGAYFLIPGAGTDGVDTINAGTAPTAGVIVTIDATCRRAMRRACFTTQKSPFVYNVPANYYIGTLTIVEVRK